MQYYFSCYSSKFLLLPQDNGASECTTCSPGYYCDNCTTSLADLHQNKICPAGLTCYEGGHTNPPNLLLNACPAGHYCLSGDIVRIAISTEY